MALTAQCFGSTATITPRSPCRRSTLRTFASLSGSSRGWTEHGSRENVLKPKGWDRPWVQPVLNNQPILAPRTAEMQGDPFGLLLRQRIIFMGGEVEDFSADAIISQLLLLDSQDPTKDLKIFINSPGGSVTAGMGIYDAMLLCRADVQTYCFGLAASMGAFLLGAGKKGKRYSMPNSRIMIHQPLGGASGQAVDIEIQAKEIMYHKANLNRIMADCTGQPLKKIEEDTDRDRYMSPLEAKEYGIIDHIIGGPEAVFEVSGSTRRFPKVKEEHVTDYNDMNKRSIMDGDPFLVTTPSWRFRSVETEPYMPSQAPGTPWFKVKKISKEQYKEMMEQSNELADEPDSPPDALPEDATEKPVPRTRNARDKIDSALA
ncbi:Clp protease-domain-containing protein [Haematococcus lacustris]